MGFSHAINSHSGKIQGVTGIAGTILTAAAIAAVLIPVVTLINALVIPIILGSLALTAWIILTALTVHLCHSKKEIVFAPSQSTDEVSRVPTIRASERQVESYTETAPTFPSESSPNSAAAPLSPRRSSEDRSTPESEIAEAHSSSPIRAPEGQVESYTEAVPTFPREPSPNSAAAPLSPRRSSEDRSAPEPEIAEEISSPPRRPSEGQLASSYSQPTEASSVEDEDVLTQEQLAQLERRNREFIKMIKKIKRERNLSALADFIDRLGVNARVNAPWNTPLISIAIFDGPLEAITFLAEKGADFNAREAIWGNTALLWAIANANNCMALEIIRVGRGTPSVNWDLADRNWGNTPLTLVISKGYKNLSRGNQHLSVSNFTLMKELVDAGADVNLSNRKGLTPLTIAVIRRDPEMVEYLIAHGASVEPSLQSQLELSYEEAQQILSKIAGPFLLDQEEFTQNKDKIFTLITRYSYPNHLSQ